MGSTDEIRLLENLMAEHPESERFVELAEQWIADGKLQQATQLCETGLGHHPDLPNGHVVYGKVLLGLDRLQDAILAFENACSLRPQEASIHAQAGLALTQFSHFDAAIPYLQNGLRLDDAQTLVQQLRQKLEEHFGTDFKKVITGQWKTEAADLQKVVDNPFNYDNPFGNNPFNSPTRPIEVPEEGLLNGTANAAAGTDDADTVETNQEDTVDNDQEKTSEDSQEETVEHAHDDTSENVDDAALGNSDQNQLGVSTTEKRESTTELSLSDVESVMPLNEETAKAPARGEPPTVLGIQPPGPLWDQIDSQKRNEPPTVLGMETHSPRPWDVDSKRYDEPPTVLGMETHSPSPWADDAKSHDEPPTMGVEAVLPDASQSGEKQQAQAHPQVASEQLAVDKKTAASPETSISYWKVFLVVVPFLIVALVGGPYVGYHVLRNEKIASLFEQARSAVANDTFAGYSNARQSLRKLLKLDPTQEQAIALLAMVEGRLHVEYGPNLAFRNSSKALLQRLSDNPPAESLAHILWARFYQKDEIDKEVEDKLNQALRSEPDNVDLMLLAAKFASVKGDLEASYKWLHAAATKDSTNLRVLSELASVEFATKRSEQAKEHLERILSYNSTHVKSALTLASLRIKNNQQLDRVQKDLELILELPQVTFRDRSQAHFLYAKISFAKDNRSRALTAVEAALDLRGDDAVFVRTLAKLCAEYYELNQADALIERLQKLDPGNLQDKIFAADIRLQRGQAKAALIALNKLVGKKVSAGPFLLLRAEVLLALDRYQAALTDLKKIPPNSPESKPAQAWLVLALLGLKKTDSARQTAVSLLREDQEFALGHFAMAHYRLAKRLQRGAIAALTRALQIDPRFYQAQRLQALIFFEKRRWDNAHQHAQLALAANPHDVRSRILLGRIALEKGDPQNALESFTRVVQEHTYDAQAYSGMAEALFALNQLDRAKVAIRKSRAAGAKDARTRHVEGSIYLANGQFHRAVNALNAANALQEDDPEILADLGLAQLGVRSLHQAEKSLKKSIQLSLRKKLPRAQEGLARLYSIRRNWLDAARAYEKAAQLARLRSWGDLEISRLYLRAGQSMIKDKKSKDARYVRARRLFRLAAKYAPQDPEPVYEEAAAFDRQDKVRSARRVYQKVLELEPEHSMTLYRLGLLEFDDGKDERANQLLGKFLETNPRGKMARQARKIIKRIK